MHHYVPGSLIIWYDSVIHDGTLRWQSALNELNYKFMQVTDGFFADYHWKEENLGETLLNYEKHISQGSSSYDIFYGIDIYGRGTFGGGRLNTHIAVKEIMKYPFSISLFGPALSYEEEDGFRDWSIF